MRMESEVKALFTIICIFMYMYLWYLYVYLFIFELCVVSNCTDNTKYNAGCLNFKFIYNLKKNKK